MRPLLILTLLAPLAACEAPPPSDTGPRARQEAACRSAIATHIGQPADRVAARWLGEDQGVAQIETRDGARLHLCRVDGTAQVLGYTHPGA